MYTIILRFLVVALRRHLASNYKWPQIKIDKVEPVIGLSVTTDYLATEQIFF